MPDVTQDYHFPKAGLDVAGPYGRQPARPAAGGVYVRTSADGKNVRSFDDSTGRDRGGSRSGLSKYIAARVVTDSWIVQHLNTLATTQGSVSSVQTSASGRVVYLVAVSQGLVKVATPDDTAWTATTNNTGSATPLNVSGVMQSSANNQKLYFVDGTNYVYYKPSTNSMETWTPTSGSLPRDTSNNGARLICTWRGRTVLAGLLKDPQNWFMTAVGDPLNFNYDPPTPVPQTAAVAGNNSPLGLIGDVITGLVPYSDDVMIFGGDHTIYAMRGDPAAGGSIDLISDITGMAWGQSWCKDPYGNIYFFGSKPSIWKMTPNGQPQRISQPIEPRIKDVNTGEYTIRMVWDDKFQRVHVYLTKSAAVADTTHYVWEYRSNSWWPDNYANTSHNPVATVTYDGNDANDRVVLIGGWDGYVRFLDPSATTDDGTAIASYVLLGPILTQETDTMLLKELQWVLGESSGAITYEILAADTAESALAAAARASGTASAGRNPTQPIRVADHAIYVKISSTAIWSMETLRAVFAARGKVRRRKP